MQVTFIKGSPLISGKKPILCEECKALTNSEVTHAVVLVAIGTKHIGLCTNHAIYLSIAVQAVEKE